MTRFFVDSNVLLRVGQPEAGFLHEASLNFLEAHPGELCVGVVVYREVQYQITRFSGRYARIPAVKHWLYVGCTKLPDHEKAEAIEELQLAYAARGWRDEPGDTGDRINAATASLFEIPYLATWDVRFLHQQDLINAINAARPLRPLRLARPDDLIGR